MLERVVIGLGSNVGNRERYLKNAIKLLVIKWNFLFVACSSIYESEPWGFKNQNNYLNCVITGLYRSRPGVLLREIKEIEHKLGRKRKRKYHPREIDLDILFFGNKVINKNNLIIPHPYLHLRNFVLEPLVEIMPDFIHPVFKKRIVTLLRESSDNGMVVLRKNQNFR